MTALSRTAGATISGGTISGGTGKAPGPGPRRGRAGIMHGIGRGVLRRIAENGGAILGVCGIVLLWTAVLHLLAAERQQAFLGAVQTTSNLSRAFEEQIIRSIKSVDQTLLYTRDAYEQDPAGFKVAAWTQKTQAITDIAFQIAFIDRNGLFKSSNLSEKPLDLSDREHFRVHRDNPGDTLFISKPVMGRASHKWSIQMTRKLIAPDGSFDGVIVVSFDPLYLSRFYDSVDVGKHGVVMLVGTDGAIRAVAREQASAPTGARAEDAAIGRTISGGQLFAEYGRKNSGTFESVGTIDEIRRIYAYRGVQGYPLIVSVGVAQAEVFAAYESDKGFDLVLALALSVLLVSVTVLVVVHQSRLDRARLLLRASETGYAEKSALLESTLEHMSQGILMVDADRRVQVCNSRAIEKLGLPAALMTSHPYFAEVLRWQWQEQEFGEDGRILDEKTRQFVLAGGSSDQPHSYERVRPNGTVLDIRSTPLQGGGFVRTFTDITAVKENERALRAARDKADGVARAKSEFLATMSHEIRSPMSGLVGVLELLQETRLDTEQQRMAGMVHSSALALLTVLNEILDFSKIEAGALSISPEPVLVRDLVSDLVQPHTLHAARKDLDLTLHFDPGLPACLEVDALRLRQIINNLLSNAIKFTAAGHIAVVLDAFDGGDGPKLRCTVSDTGIGMPEAVVARLFEPFMQADGSTTRTYGGTGLGLCISQRLARLLDGTLSVASREGEGSTFTVLLPLKPATMPAPVKAAVVPKLVAVAAGVRVLVVDDEHTNRWLAQRQFGLLGLKVDLAENGEQALEMLQANRYDLLLTDCHMPRMDGVALTFAVRADADPVLSGMPIIGLTADVTSTQLDRCREAGMNEVAYKPLSRDRLAVLLAGYLPAKASGPELSDAVPGPAATALVPGMHPSPETPGPAAFDAGIYRELFPEGDPEGDAEGAAWLAEYVESAGELGHELTVLVGAEPLPRAAIAAAAHRLAGNSLSVGATRLGEVTRKLEHAAKEADPEFLLVLHATLQTELAAAGTAVSAFIAELQMETAS